MRRNLSTGVAVIIENSAFPFSRFRVTSWKIWLWQSVLLPLEVSCGDGFPPFLKTCTELLISGGLVVPYLAPLKLIGELIHLFLRELEVLGEVGICHGIIEEFLLGYVIWIYIICRASIGVLSTVTVTSSCRDWVRYILYALDMRGNWMQNWDLDLSLFLVLFRLILLRNFGLFLKLYWFDLCFI